MKGVCDLLGLSLRLVKLLLVLVYTIVLAAPVYFLIRLISVRFNDVVRA